MHAIALSHAGGHSSIVSSSPFSCCSFGICFMKKKPIAQSGPPLTGKPFKPLKSPATSATDSGRKKTVDADEDDFSLFLRAVEGARRVDRDPSEPAHPAAAAGKKVSAPDESHIFLSAMRKAGPTVRDLSQKQETEDTGRQSSSSSRMRQLKSGVIRIGRELDLHGVLKDEALRQLARFLTNASVHGHQAVLVITGKGINSPEGPVLRGAVGEWLRSAGKTLVAAFSKAPREMGGSGAFVVFLRNK